MCASMSATLVLLMHAGLCHIARAGLPAGTSPDTAATSSRTEVTLAAGGSMTAKAAPTAQAVNAEPLIRRETTRNQDRHLAPVEVHAQTIQESDMRKPAKAAFSELTQATAAHKSTTTEEHTSTEHPDGAWAPATSTTYDPLGSEDGHWVSCGGHQAPRCRVCTILDPDSGLPWPNDEDKGADWCRGNCKWYDGECQAASNWNVLVPHNKGEPWANEKHTTSFKADLVNPELTVGDKDLIDHMANAAVSEADYEARQRESNQAKDDEEKKDKEKQFLFIVVMTMAVCLGCCACAACVAVARYALHGGKKKALHAGQAGDWAQEEWQWQETHGEGS